MFTFLFKKSLNIFSSIACKSTAASNNQRQEHNNSATICGEKILYTLGPFVQIADIVQNEYTSLILMWCQISSFQMPSIKERKFGDIVFELIQRRDH